MTEIQWLCKSEVSWSPLVILLAWEDLARLSHTGIALWVKVWDEWCDPETLKEVFYVTSLTASSELAAHIKRNAVFV